MWQLFTIPFSHYCEKARWALDYSRRPYQERAYLPGLHLTATALRGHGKTVPMLKAGAEHLTDSSDILQFVDRERESGVPGLFGNDDAARSEVLRLEDWLDENLGPSTRLLAYHYLLDSIPTLVQVAGQGYGPLGKLSLGVTMRGLRGGIRKGYRITPDRAAQGEERVRKAFAETDARLAGSPFLVGSRFTAADLTLAALSGPVLMWPESIHRHDRQIVTQDPIELLPDSFKATVQSLRKTPTGQHAQRLYRDWRRVSS
ncbi:glutathione S-transferase family protein [Oligoflexus tunisiensis]|uniref:glutathione S-transferase family protein n=1 Tax=Oligoflexus tunisiensis TaxID=708132 RepID=UPI000A440D74|nr:glutathione S-transferase family protein [Oligoflexus tunisiensis]